MSFTPPESPNLLVCPAVPELPEGEGLVTKKAPPLPPPPPRKKRRVVLWVVLGLVLLVGILAAPLVYGGVSAFVAERAFERSLQAARTAIEQGDFEQGGGYLAQADASLRDMQVGVQRTGGWKYMPWIGPRLQSLEQAASAGAATIDAMQDLITVAQTLTEAGLSFAQVGPGVEPHRSFKDLTVDERRAILAKLSNSLSDLRLAREKIYLALQSWDEVDVSVFPSDIRATLEQNVGQLRELGTSLDQSISLLDVFIPLVGYPSEKKYLVLLQNPDELRPAGGFIGVIGTLRVDAGNIEEFNFGDVYSQDAPLDKRWTDEPPYPLKHWLGVPFWYVRDGNWSPDFPQSAEQVLSMYERAYAIRTGGTISFDGVIGLEPGLFRSLLHVTGPLMVEGKTFTPENFFDLLEYDVEKGFNEKGIPVAQRKEVVSRVGDELMNKLQALPAARWPEILAVVSEALAKKDVLLYTHDPALLRRLDSHAWTGRTAGSAGDYLWVVDANVAALKTDGVMQKEIMYSVDAARSDEVLATVRLRYTNTNTSFTWRYSRYRSYTRVFVPEGSELVSAEGHMVNDKTQTGGQMVPGVVDIGRDLGKTYFGAFWAIEPGETRDLVFTYRLPPTIADQLRAGSYQLIVQKQPGTNTRLTLGHAFGKNIQRAVPGEDLKEFGDTYYRTSLPLDRDLEFNVSF
jgi:hypothetical protein